MRYTDKQEAKKEALDECLWLLEQGRKNTKEYADAQLILRDILEDNNQVARKALKARHNPSIQAQELLESIDVRGLK